MEASTPAPPPPPPPPEPSPPPAGPAPGAYPVRLDAERQDEYHRFLPLVKWLLAFPHYIVLFFLAIGVIFVKIVAFFAVLFTGRYPRGMYDFVAGVIRWSWRVTAYVYLLRDEYPPFTLDEDPSYPATFEIDYPEQIDRWRPLVQWLLAIPYLIVAGRPRRRRRDRRVHRHLRDPVHEGAPEGNVRPDPDPVALADPRHGLRLLHGRPLPALRLGRIRPRATRPAP